MDRIIKAVADETKARGARRVTPSHLYVPPVVHGIMVVNCYGDVDRIITLRLR